MVGKTLLNKAKQRTTMNVIISLHDPNYQPLADLTWNQNKVLYAEKNGYAAECKTNNFKGGVSIGYEKIWFIKELMADHPEYEWIWWTGTDTLVTNFNVKIEDRIDNNYHFIIATDCNGINADSFLVRNSPEGRAYIDFIWDNHEEYEQDGWKEQRCIISNLEKFKDIIKIVPQRDLNAYNYALYPHCQPYDKSENYGQWQPGDWLIHWPGIDLFRRLQLASFYMQHVVK